MRLYVVLGATCFFPKVSSLPCLIPGVSPSLAKEVSLRMLSVSDNSREQDGESSKQDSGSQQVQGTLPLLLFFTLQVLVSLASFQIN